MQLAAQLATCSSAVSCCSRRRQCFLAFHLGVHIIDINFATVIMLQGCEVFI